MLNQETSTQELPPIPALTIAPTPINTASNDYLSKRRGYMMLDDQQQFQGTKDEVQKKLKKNFQRAEENSTQLESTGQGSTIDITTLERCPRCERWLRNSEMGLHLSYHAAVITDNLLLGDKYCAQSKKQLIQRMKVTHVVNAAYELNNYLEKDGIKYIQLGLLDTFQESLIEQIEKAYKFIKEAHDQKGIVFVHCAVGKSRSVSVILLYLFLEKGMSMKQALQAVKLKRSIAQPNTNYMRQLLQYEQNYLKKKEQEKSSSQSQCQASEIETINSKNNDDDKIKQKN